MAATAVFQEHVGRDMQRYSESGQRMVCICVPVYDSRVVLIQSLRKGDWIIPKGGWDSNETSEEAARREAWEESGVQGDSATLMFEESTDKHVYLYYKMAVNNVLQDYPEKGRPRQFVAPEEALALCCRPDMQRAIRTAFGI